MVTNIINELKLNEWREVNLKSLNDCYIIAIKNKTFKKPTKINLDDIKQIRFELGIDSGIKNKPLTIQFFNLNFRDVTSSDKELNEITAFTRLINVPNEFYIKAISVDDGTKEITEGNCAIDININSLDLG